MCMCEASGGAGWIWGWEDEEQPRASFPCASESGVPRAGGSVQRAQGTGLVEKVELSSEFLWLSAGW